MGYEHRCLVKRRLSVTNLRLENSFPKFRLDDPVIISTNQQIVLSSFMQKPTEKLLNNSFMGYKHICLLFVTSGGVNIIFVYCTSLGSSLHNFHLSMNVVAMNCPNKKCSTLEYEMYQYYDILCTLVSEASCDKV